MSLKYDVLNDLASTVRRPPLQLAGQQFPTSGLTQEQRFAALENVVLALAHELSLLAGEVDKLADEVKLL